MIRQTQMTSHLPKNNNSIRGHGKLLMDYDKCKQNLGQASLRLGVNILPKDKNCLLLFLRHTVFVNIIIIDVEKLQKFMLLSISDQVMKIMSENYGRF